MKKRFIPVLILITYSAILIKVMVFKDVPLIRVGQLMLNFGGTAEGQANFIPFKTIVPYLLGYKGWIIAGINLIGNIALLVPIGFLAPLIWRNINWKRALALGIAAGFAIEVTQVLLRVGIFDIDDVILNALGVMVGYGAVKILMRWIQSKNYASIIVAAALLVAMVVGAMYVLYPKDQPVMPAGGADLCGGTGGVGEIVSIEKNGFTIKRKDSRLQTVTLSDLPTIKTPNGNGSLSDLKVGERATIVGDGNSDGTFTAHTVLVCKPKM